MKILKKLFGKSDVKIDANEIAVAPNLLLGDAVIVETGKNENGEWIKFGNGYMICYLFIEFNKINNVEGSLYASAKYEWTYPHPFINDAADITGTVIYQSDVSWIASDSFNTPKLAKVRLVSAKINNSAHIGVRLTAAGRWK